MIRVLAVSAFFALAACSDYEIVGGNDNVEPGDGRTGGLRTSSEQLEKRASRSMGKPRHRVCAARCPHDR